MAGRRLTVSPSSAALYCARCDGQVIAGARVCPFNVAGSSGKGRSHAKPCGSRAFYRGRKPQRHIMGPALDDEPPILAEAPVPARRTNHGHRSA